MCLTAHSRGIPALQGGEDVNQIRLRNKKGVLDSLKNYQYRLVVFLIKHYYIR